MKKTTICHKLLELDRRPQTKPALMFKKKGKWNELTWSDYKNEIQKTAFGLLNLGVNPNDKVAIMSNTRYEWSTTDFAILSVGAISVPIYQTVTPEDMQYILNNSETKVLFIENANLLKGFLKIRSACPTVEKVILFEESDAAAGTQGVILLSDLKNSVPLSDTTTFNKWKGLIEKSDIDDVATVVYTSGTSGQPKGVTLCHRQILSEVRDAFPMMTATHEDTSLTFLPYAHVMGRIESWGHLEIGFTMAYAESIEKIKSNLTEIRPTFMVAVPRIFEKVYAAAWAQIEANPIKAKIFRTALAVGLKVGQHRLKREPIPLTLIAPYALAKKIALDNIKALFGGRLRFCVSGGAPMARDIALFFYACEVLILEGYGLTETTAAVFINTPADHRFGSVGKPVGDVQMKFAEDGEILIKSDKVMKEYYKNPEATAETIVDGWFHTGDIGELTESGDLKITDRKKDLIKTAGGKYVAPQRLENMVKIHSFISNVLIHGDQKKYIVALLTLDRQFLVRTAKEKNLIYDDIGTLCNHPSILEIVRKSIAEVNAELASFESIKRFSVIPNEFTIESGELTPSMKVKRKFCDNKYKKEIDALYT